jgi:dihydrofolate reductase
MSVRLSMVAAVARNGVIGAGGGLAWKISGDLKWFKSVTMGKPVIMGRKTFDSIGRALPGRDNIVVTRSLEFAAAGVFVARTLDGVVTLGEELAEARGAEECCIIGGAEIYTQLLNRTERIYLTRVDASVEGDVFFPALDSDAWNETKASRAEKSAKNEFACDFFILDRKARICAKEA